MNAQRYFNQKYLESSIASFNRSGLEMLKENAFKKAQYYFSQALVMSKSLNSSNINKPLNLLNSLMNLGLYHKAQLNLMESLRYFQEALTIEKDLPNISMQSISLQLHISSVHSLLNDHETALRYALKSLYLLKRLNSHASDYIESLIISLYNIAVEYEYLKEYKDSEDYYIKGYNLSLQHLGQTHPLTLQIKGSITEILLMKNDKKYRLDLEYLKKDSTAPSESSRRKNSSCLKTRRSSSMSMRLQSIDVEIHKKIENRAAVVIQKMWRGCVARKKFNEYALKIRVANAAKSAQIAIARYEQEKKRLESARSRGSTFQADTKKLSGLSPVMRLMSLKKMKEANYE